MISLTHVTQARVHVVHHNPLLNAFKTCLFKVLFHLPFVTFHSIVSQCCQVHCMLFCMCFFNVP